ncbi:F-box protein CPR30-like [Olea europaea var. sylvestris]|uniref:F-box protein CPR30-like n=1 Tax=Olea europaea var. sylvestris TaxID=158386 RepID=UPI000C1D5545|nr:F-box protein CPR30-like [Olea europaea var. sylvestris]
MSLDPVAFAPIAKFNLALHQASNISEEIIYVGSINGLVCITNHCCDWICVWNPSTRFLKELPPATEVPRMVSIGFGWDPAVNDYKVVRLCCGCQNLVTWVEVWSARPTLQSWREINVYHNFYVQRLICHVILEGFIYWIAVSDSKPVVVSFIVRSEVLRVVPVPELLLEGLPLPHLTRWYDNRLLNRFLIFAMNWKESFALVGCASVEHRKIYQVWTMENDAVGKESWSKKFTFELDIEPVFISCVNGILVLKKETGELILYDVETRESKKIEILGVDAWVIGVHYYVESLLSIKRVSWASLLCDGFSLDEELKSAWRRHLLASKQIYPLSGQAKKFVISQSRYISRGALEGRAPYRTLSAEGTRELLKGYL